MHRPGALERAGHLGSTSSTLDAGSAIRSPALSTWAGAKTYSRNTSPASRVPRARSSSRCAGARTVSMSRDPIAVSVMRAGNGVSSAPARSTQAARWPALSRSRQA